MALMCALSLIASYVMAIASQAMPSQAERGAGEVPNLMRDRVALAALLQADTLPEPTYAKLCLGKSNEPSWGMLRAPTYAHQGCIAADLDSHTSAQVAAIMLKAGMEGESNVSATDIRYAQAALGRHAESEDKLALLDGDSEGVPNDLGIAHDWFAQPDSRPKAADLILAQLEPVTSEKSAMAAPEGVETNVSPKEDQWQIDLVWTALPGPSGSLFVVELVTIPSGSDGESELVAFEQTEASATTVFVDRVPVGLAWRVSQIAVDGSDYAAGVWTELSAGTERSQAETALAPVGRVTIRVGPADVPAQQLARDLAIGLGAAGIWTHLEEVELDQTESTVAYRYAADAELASSIASYLPVLGPDDATRQVEIPAAPGEVVVTLVGGPTSDDVAD